MVGTVGFAVDVVANVIGGGPSHADHAFTLTPNGEGNDQTAQAQAAQAQAAQTTASSAASTSASLREPLSASDQGSQMRPASEREVAEAQINRRAAAIAAVYRIGGEVDAAQELRTRTRDLSPALAAEVVVAARVTVESIVTAFGRPHAGSDREVTRLAQMEADFAATIAHMSRDPRGEVLARDMATLVLDSSGGRGDEYRLSSFSLGIPFGTGLAFPLALADELDRRRDRRRQGRIVLAMEQGLRRLKDRIAATVGALIELTLPVSGLLSAERAADIDDGDRSARLVREYAAHNARFMNELSGALQRVDIVGSDVFFALDALSRRASIPAELLSVRAELLDSPATAFAIAHSASAQDAALQRSHLPSPPSDDQQHTQRQTSTETIQSTQRVYAGLGFSTSLSALLARTTWQSAVLMETRWAVLHSNHDLKEQGRAFDALLRFMGVAATPRCVSAVELSHVDDAERSAWGLPLWRSLERDRVIRSHALEE